MRLFVSFSTFAVAVLAAPKVLICSDSTTANYAQDSVLQGYASNPPLPLRYPL